MTVVFLAALGVLYCVLMVFLIRRRWYGLALTLAGLTVLGGVSLIRNVFEMLAIIEQGEAEKSYFFQAAENCTPWQIGSMFTAIPGMLWSVVGY